MKILGIDSSGLVASVALAEEEELLAEFTVNNKKTHSQTLLPMLDEMMTMSGIAIEEIDAIAVASGPGSFTGLRIGSATAKGLGLALNKPIVSVPTLDGLAYQMAGVGGIICPIMDARRNQVYTAAYRMTGQKPEIVMEQCAIDIQELLRILAEYKEDIHFLGDGVPVYREQIENNYAGTYDFAPAHKSRQSAGAIAVLGGCYWKEGRMESAAEHRPFYLRKSQAERERAERLKGC